MDTLQLPQQEMTHWRASGDGFQYRGHDIFFRQAGNADAPTLLLLHGFPTSSFDWAPLFERLAEHFHVVAADMLGFGFSAKPWPYPYSIFDQADLQQALLARLGRHQHPLHLLAHDYGDTVAQELLARDNPGQIASVVLLNGGLFPETHLPVLIQKLLISPLGPLVARLTNYRSFQRNFDRICARPLGEPLLQTYWQLLTHNRGTRALPGLIRYMRERRKQRSRWVGALQSTQIPVRLIDGLDDPISGAHMVARYRQLITHADVVELPGVGHYPQVEDTEAVWQAALSFWHQHQVI